MSESCCECGLEFFESMSSATHSKLYAAEIRIERPGHWQHFFRQETRSHCLNQMQASSTTHSRAVVLTDVSYFTELQQPLAKLERCKTELNEWSQMHSRRAQKLVQLESSLREKFAASLRADDGSFTHLRKYVQTSFLALPRLMGSIYIWLAKSFDAMSPSSKYQNATWLSLVCVRNDSCVVKTAPGCKRLLDTARGCSVLAEAHKKLDKAIKFLTCCIYSLVLEQTGENWINDKALGPSATYYTIKNLARELVLTQ